MQKKQLARWWLLRWSRWNLNKKFITETEENMTWSLKRFLSEPIHPPKRVWFHLQFAHFHFPLHKIAVLK
jgi:hypothetical protein